ncbi:MAG: 50S ribosomal protein L25 [Candidatus Peribacteraceae bacterium]|nr:50S ribosomal protein L25 [Candidatus Peribacteraceae bacterium]MDD5742737.1 50S ribosomal protein L25 [Candidatus Peribacteraceae bacterium]
MEMVSLTATARAKGTPSEIRRGNGVPCVLYGNEVKNTQMQCASLELTKAYTKAGANTLVDLDIDGKKVPVLFHQLQFHPITGKISHVDFYAVNLKKEIEAPVPLRFTGEALAVKEFAAVIVTVQNHVTVRCLPMDLPHDIEASLTKLSQVHDVVKVMDLVAPSGVTILDDPETVLVTAQEQRKEEEVLPTSAATVEGAPAEGAASAEGAPTAEGAAAAPAAAEAPAKKEKKGKE